MSNDVNPEYRGANDKYGTEYDVTQLHEGLHGTRVHRDYLAHVLRWGWAARSICSGDKVFDFGCGQDLPLAQVLAGTPSFGGDASNGRPQYVGVDLNKIKKKFGAKWATIAGETNVLDMTDEARRAFIPYWGEFDVVTSFEVIEHMSVANGDRYLAAAFDALHEGGSMYLSTPVFNGKAAKNHIHEYEIPELQAKVEAAGFKVMSRWGTFMSWNDMKKVATPDQVELAKALRVNLGGEVVACFLASLYPDASRNNVWVLAKPAA